MDVGRRRRAHDRRGCACGGQRPARGARPDLRDAGRRLSPHELRRGARGDRPRGVRRPDGRLVAAGWSDAPTSSTDPTSRSRIALVGLTSRGRLDSSFGTGGRVVTDLPSAQEGARAMARLTDGGVVVAGWADDRMLVARYTAAGRPRPVLRRRGRRERRPARPRGQGERRDPAGGWPHPRRRGVRRAHGDRPPDRGRPPRPRIRLGRRLARGPRPRPRRRPGDGDRQPGADRRRRPIRAVCRDDAASRQRHARSRLRRAWLHSRDPG